MANVACVNHQHIVAYYDATSRLYRHLWYRNSGSYALHYGFWDNGARTLGEALQNTNAFLARAAGVQPHHVVLDAGTGVGGSALWIASHIGARVIGITLSEGQVAEARTLAHKRGVADRATFSVMDYTRTEFPDASFDVVWAVESVCHARRKGDFLAEARRVLKPGGMLTVADGFLNRRARTEAEQQMLKEFLEGLALPGLDLVQQFRASLEETGFTRVAFWDKTEAVLPSSRRLYRLGRLMYPFAVMAEKAGAPCAILTKHSLAAIRQYQLVCAGLMGYGVFCAEKERNRGGTLPMPCPSRAPLRGSPSGRMSAASRS